MEEDKEEEKSKEETPNKQIPGHSRTVWDQDSFFPLSGFLPCGQCREKKRKETKHDYEVSQTLQNVIATSAQSLAAAAGTTPEVTAVAATEAATLATTAVVFRVATSTVTAATAAVAAVAVTVVAATAAALTSAAAVTTAAVTVVLREEASGLCVSLFS